MMKLLISILLSLSFCLSVLASQVGLELTKNEAPYYPVQASVHEKTGFIKVSIVFNQQGQVIDIDILNGKNIKTFEEAVLVAVANWQAAPFSHLPTQRLERTFSFGMPSSNGNSSSTSEQKTTTATKESIQQIHKKHKRLYKGYRQYVKRKHGTNGESK
jgi:TonB family protein